MKWFGLLFSDGLWLVLFYHSLTSQRVTDWKLMDWCVVVIPLTRSIKIFFLFQSNHRTVEARTVCLEAWHLIDLIRFIKTLHHLSITLSIVYKRRLCEKFTNSFYVDLGKQKDINNPPPFLVLLSSFYNALFTDHWIRSGRSRFSFDSLRTIVEHIDYSTQSDILLIFDRIRQNSRWLKIICEVKCRVTDEITKHFSPRNEALFYQWCK